MARHPSGRPLRLRIIKLRNLPEPRPLGYLTERLNPIEDDPNGVQYCPCGEPSAACACNDDFDPTAPDVSLRLQ